MDAIYFGWSSFQKWVKISSAPPTTKGVWHNILGIFLKYGFHDLGGVEVSSGELDASRVDRQGDFLRKSEFLQVDKVDNGFHNFFWPKWNLENGNYRDS